MEPSTPNNSSRWRGIVNDYPLPAYNYKVSVGGQDVAFSEVTGLQIAYETVVYKHGLSYVTGPEIVRGQQVPSNIILRRGMVHRRHELLNWLNSGRQLNIFIDLCDEKGEPLIRWKIFGGMPVKIDTPGLNANTNDVAIESIEIAAHHITIEYLEST